MELIPASFFGEVRHFFLQILKGHPFSLAFCFCRDSLLHLSLFFTHRFSFLFFWKIAHWFSWLLLFAAWPTASDGSLSRFMREQEWERFLVLVPWWCCICKCWQVMKKFVVHMRKKIRRLSGWRTGLIVNRLIVWIYNSM